MEARPSPDTECQPRSIMMRVKGDPVVIEQHKEKMKSGRHSAAMYRLKLLRRALLERSTPMMTREVAAAASQLTTVHMRQTEPAKPMSGLARSQSYREAVSFREDCTSVSSGMAREGGGGGAALELRQ